MVSYLSTLAASVLLLSLIGLIEAEPCPTTCSVANFESDFNNDYYLAGNNAPTREECLTFCNQTPGSVLYTYSAEFTSCYCYSACGFVDPSDGYVTGLFSACSASNSSVKNDPHFTGAHGTLFDFNGINGATFCLTTDTNLHINALFKGTDSRRTFLREVAFLSKTASGSNHILHLVARDGKQQARGSGFVASLMLDSKPLAVPNKLGAGLQTAGLNFTFEGTHKDTTYSFLDADHFRLKIADLADILIYVMPGHPKEQDPGEAEVHFNLNFDHLKVSEKVDGVLGQTYLSSDAQMAKVKKFKEIVRLLRRPVKADGDSGKGFLKGHTIDYKTTSISAADCKVSAFV